MIKFEHTEVVGWEAAIRGMRNPMNSWDKSDSYIPECPGDCQNCPNGECQNTPGADGSIIIGPNDHDLMMRLRNAGTDHRKFMRMIAVYVDITAPLYWWKEFDTYKVGSVANSCSTMHKIHEKPFTVNDISIDTLMRGNLVNDKGEVSDPLLKAHYKHMMNILNSLNNLRDLYLKTNDKRYWRCMIEMLPSSYNQKRTIMFNYEVLANIYKSRKDHKLDEWREFCTWIEDLPYSELICGPEFLRKEFNVKKGEEK